MTLALPKAKSSKCAGKVEYKPERYIQGLMMPVPHLMS